MPDINLSPYAPETAAIQRRLQMAQLLSQQAMQPMEVPQQAGVRASHYGGLAKILQGYMAGKEEKGALEEYKNLAEKYQGQNQADLQNFLGAVQGTPQKEFAGPAPQGAPQPMTPEGEAGGYIQPEQKPDRQRAMALALGSQNPTLQGAGGALLSQMFAQDKIKDFKVELVDGKTHRIGLTETGKRIDLGPVAESVSVDTAARLKFDKEQADRAFTQLSAKDKAQLENDAKRLNISAQQLFFDTGIKAGGGTFVNPIAQPPAPTAPPAQPNVAPNAPPMRAPVAPVAPNVSAAPVAGNPVTPTAQPSYTPLAGLSPKAQQQMALESFQAQQKTERGMQGIGNVIDNARSILQGKAKDEQGNPIKAPLPTQSYGGALQDILASTYGGAPQGSAQADRLKVLGGALTMAMPRMEGPQSDRDMQLYREMSGQIGDNTLSVARRLEALSQVEALYRKYDKTSPVAPAAFVEQPPAGAVRRIR
jgi:hypothetical protein